MTGRVLAVAQSSSAPNDVTANVSTHVRLARAAAGQGADFVLFPELALTGYRLDFTAGDALAPDDARLRPLRAVADESAIMIVSGAPVASPDGLCIGAVTFGPGRPAAVYTKQYLHPGEEVCFTAGAGGRLLGLGKHAVALAICAEITQPWHAAAAASAGADVYAASCYLTPGGYAADTALLHEYACRHDMLVMMANYATPPDHSSTAGRSAIWHGEEGPLAVAPPAGEALVLARRKDSGWSGEVVVS